VKSNITDEEFSILDAVMKRHKTVKKYIIDREENALTLYVSGDYDEIRSYLKDEDFRKMQQYDEKMRFEKNATGEFTRKDSVSSANITAGLRWKRATI
jgi:hypothetical protein